MTDLDHDDTRTTANLPESPEPISAGSVGETTSSAELVLVDVDEDTTLVFGTPPSEWDLQPIPVLSEASRGRLTEAVAQSLGLATVAATGINAVNAAQGLVRLAPETVAALKAATPMTSGGWNLGALTQHGKIVAQIKWAPAGVASGVAVLAAAGPALTMLAMQHQMSLIQRAVEENIDLTKQVLQVIDEAQWAELDGLNRSLMNALSEAEQVGEVSPHVWAAIAGREPELNAARTLFTRKVERHLESLRACADAKERRAWLQRNVQPLISDVQAMMLAEQGWYTYQFLRGGSVVASSSHHADTALARTIADRAQREHRANLDKAGGLLDELARVFGMLAELPGRTRFQFAGARRSAGEVAVVAKATAAWIAALRGTGGAVLPDMPAAPPISTIVDPEESTTVLSRLRWSLQPDEEILALATVRAAHPRCDYVAVTNQRMLLADASDLERGGRDRDGDSRRSSSIRAGGTRPDTSCGAHDQRHDQGPRPAVHRPGHG